MPTTLSRAVPSARVTIKPLAFQQEHAACMPETGDVLIKGLDIGSATDVGRVREANEDALLLLAPGDVVKVLDVPRDQRHARSQRGRAISPSA